MVPDEEAEREGDLLRARRTPVGGAHVRRAGEDVRRGAPLLHPGRVVRPFELALLVGAGVRRVQVVRRPVIALLPTGDELARAARRTAVCDAVSPALAALVRAAGGAPRPHPVAADRLPAVCAALRRAARGADLVITVGGVSRGPRDFMRPALRRLGGVVFAGVAMKPGKPVAFGFVGRVPVLALPGNPGSALITFLELAEPAIRALAGRPALHQDARARLSAGLRGHRRRTLYLWARVRRRGGALRARLAGPVGSHRLAPAAEANALIVLPAGTGSVAAGRPVAIRWLPGAAEAES